MELSINIAIVSFLILKTIGETVGDCTLSLKNDFGDHTPVYVKSGAILKPNTDDILLRRSESLLVGCPGKNRSVVLGDDTANLNVVKVQCVSDTSVRVGLWQGDFKNIRCNAPPGFTVEPSDVDCQDGRTLFRVGYKVASEFYVLYEACFHKQLVETLYVRQVKTANKFDQRDGKNPLFTDTSIFAKVRTSYVNAVKNRSPLSLILRNSMDRHDINKIKLPSLDSDAPSGKANFIWSVLQRTTIDNVNAAPQPVQEDAVDSTGLERVNFKSAGSSSAHSSAISSGGSSSAHSSTTSSKESSSVHSLAISSGGSSSAHSSALSSRGSSSVQSSASSWGGSSSAQASASSSGGSSSAQSSASSSGGSSSASASASSSG